MITRTSTRLKGNLLFGVDAGNPAVFALVSALLAIAALAGATFPPAAPPRSTR